MCSLFLPSQDNDISGLKAAIEASPKHRLYVKLGGRLRSSQPIKVNTASGTEHSAVLTAHEIVYLQGLNLSGGKAVVNNVSTADEVQLEVGATENVKGPKLIVDPRCLEFVQRDHVDSVEKDTGSRSLSAVLAIVGITWPYRSITNTMIVPQNRHVFAAVDATVDLAGNVTLVRPNSFDRKAIMTAESATTATDDLANSMRLWTAASITTGVLGVLCGAAGFRASQK